MGTKQFPHPVAAADLDDRALYRLLTWLSPGFPTGAFSYSHGIEFAVEAGLLRTADDLTRWIETMVLRGPGRMEAMLFCAAYRAATTVDDASLAEVAELAAAHQATAETALESAAQGAAFVVTCRSVWPSSALNRLAAVWSGPVALPVAVAVACAGHGVPICAGATAYLHAFVANFVSAGVRLIPLGQTEGQVVIARLEASVGGTVERALATPLDELGSAVPMVDWACARHETQYARLFRS